MVANVGDVYRSLTVNRDAMRLAEHRINGWPSISAETLPSDAGNRRYHL
jgi:hypothetical protein